MFKLIIWVCLVHLSRTDDDNKWVWKNRGRKADDSVEIVAKSRYEIVEDNPDDYRPNFQRPIHPVGINQGSSFPSGTGHQGPFIPNQRPEDIEYLPNHHVHGGFYPSNGGAGILTGPMHPWVKDLPFKQYDTCKCAEKFNCNSPGISYGQCDVGKQYCCYYSKRPGSVGSPLPSTPIHSPENGVLVGPGGPSIYPIRPHSPYPRPPGYGVNVGPGGGYGGNDVLVGPGGPTGNVGRPPNGGNFHSPDFGVLVGPGARPGYNGFGYGRNAKTAKS